MKQKIFNKTSFLISIIAGLGLICAGLFGIISCDESSRKDILLLSPRNPDLRVNNSLYDALTDYFDDLRYNLVQVTVPGDDNNEEIANNVKFVDHCLDSLSALEFVPEIILSYGDKVTNAIASSSKDEYNTLPVIFFGLLSSDRQGLISRHDNFTGYKMELGIKQNLDLIRDLGLPTWTVTVVDDGYRDFIIRNQILGQLADTSKYHSNIYFQQDSVFVPASERDPSVSVLLPVSVKNPHHNKKGPWGREFDLEQLFDCRNNFLTFLSLKEDKYMDIPLKRSIGKYFTAIPEHFNINQTTPLNACAGGYFTPYTVMAEEVFSTAQQILKQNLSPQDIPISNHKRGYYLDWNIVGYPGLYATDFPKYVHFVNMPKKVSSKAVYTLSTLAKPLALGLFWLALIITLVIVTIRNKQHSKAILKLGHEASRDIERISEVLSVTNGHFFTANSSGQIIFSDEFYKSLGIKRRPVSYELYLRGMDNIQKATLVDWLNDDDKGHSFKSMNVTITEPVTGHSHYVNLSVEKFFDDDGEKHILGMVIIMDKILKIEQERLEAFKSEQDYKLKSSFLASMGHEIRTPLNAIVGYSQILFSMSDQLSDEERDSYAKVINQNTTQLLSLIDNVLNYSEGQDEPEIVLSEKHVSELMEELYMTHSILVPKHLKFKYEKGSDEDFIKVNRGSLLQVVSNLMNNAVKFTQKGSITMGWRSDDKNVFIYVTDTGCGIAEDMIDTVFDKYAKAESSTMGAGIGLALCKRLIEKMHGEIRVHSELGKGSTFEVVFEKIDCPY